MDELGLTDGELAWVLRACAWVKATADFLPYVRAFLKVRLTHQRQAILAGKIATLDARQSFRLWERLKDEQIAPSLLQTSQEAHSLSKVQKQSQW